jgi:hypothetical protein
MVQRGTGIEHREMLKPDFFPDLQILGAIVQVWFPIQGWPVPL